MGATQSVLLYGAEVWTDALDKEVHRNRLAQVQSRGAMRVVSAYRTISETAVMVIAEPSLLRSLPWSAKLSTAVRARTYERWLPAKNINAALLSGNFFGKMSQEAEGARLIDKSDPWLNCTHSEIDYFLTQLLSGGRRDLLIVCSAM